MENPVHAITKEKNVSRAGGMKLKQNKNLYKQINK